MDDTAALRADEQTITLHQRILADIEGNILSGEWPPGYRIPFETELALHYGCSRMTVNKVMTQLAQNGLIERRKKSGSFVILPHAQSAVLEIRDIKVEVQSLGLSYSYQMVEKQLRKASAEERLRLDIKAGPILHLVCQHFAGRKPFCLEERIINLDAVPEASDESFLDTAPGAWLMNRVPWSSAEHRIKAIGADQKTAELLGLSTGTACLVIERRTKMMGAYVTDVRLTYPGALYELVANFTPQQSK
jgi:GntR family histidine utilization transcriptional repressor